MRTVKQPIESKKWYEENRALYEQLSETVEKLIKGLLTEHNITFQNISHRAKEIQSFVEKSRKDKYSEPDRQITDLAGIRVITYLDSDVSRICKLIEQEFKIDIKNSINKSQALKVNEFGYRSVHYVACLPRQRTKLSEYKKFKDLQFEIQIRTVLQHAWAEIEHDRSYKFSGVLPSDIKRRFYVVSGVLEMVDREFELLAKDIDDYASKVKEATNKGDLNIEINSTSLFEYMSAKFNFPHVEKSLRSASGDLIDELNAMKISTLAQLDKIISSEFIDYLSSHGETNFVGILRDIMIIHDGNLFFSKAWGRKWNGIDEDSYALYKHFDSKIDALIDKYELDLIIGAEYPDFNEYSEEYE